MSMLTYSVSDIHRMGSRHKAASTLVGGFNWSRCCSVPHPILINLVATTATNPLVCGGLNSGRVLNARVCCHREI